SRRRHTRFSRDWSSDVCSSDLCIFIFYLQYMIFPELFTVAQIDQCKIGIIVMLKGSEIIRFGKYKIICAVPAAPMLIRKNDKFRSEERRGGKECRARQSRGHES